MFNNDKKLHLLQHALNNHKQLKCKISHRKINEGQEDFQRCLWNQHHGAVGTRHSDSFHKRSVQTRRSSSLVLFCTRLDWLYMSRSSQCSLFYDEPSVISLLIGCPSQTVPCSFGYMNAHLDFPPKQQTSSSLNRWSNQTLDAHSRSRPPRAEGNAADVYCIRSQSCDAPPAQLNMIRQLNMEPHVDLFQQRADAPRSAQIKG